MTTDTFVIDAGGRHVIEKDPSAILDYSFDWTAYLAAVSDAISTATIILSPDGATVDSFSSDGNIVTVWISGGILGDTISVTCRITTTAGRTDERTFYIYIVDR